MNRLQESSREKQSSSIDESTNNEQNNEQMQQKIKLESVEKSIDNAKSATLNHFEKLCPNDFINGHTRTIQFRSNTDNNYHMIREQKNDFLAIKNEIIESNKLIVLFGLRDKGDVEHFLDCAKTLEFLDGKTCPVRIRYQSDSWTDDNMAQATCTASFPYVLSMFEPYTDCPLTFKVVEGNEPNGPSYIIYADSYGPAAQLFGETPKRTRADVETLIILLYTSKDSNGCNLTEAYGSVSVTMDIPRVTLPFIGDPIRQTIASQIPGFVKDIFVPVIKSYLNYIHMNMSYDEKNTEDNSSEKIIL